MGFLDGLFGHASPSDAPWREDSLEASRRSFDAQRVAMLEQELAVLKRRFLLDRTKVEKLKVRYLGETTFFLRHMRVYDAEVGQRIWIDGAGAFEKGPDFELVLASTPQPTGGA